MQTVKIVFTILHNNATIAHYYAAVL